MTCAKVTGRLQLLLWLALLGLTFAGDAAGGQPIPGIPGIESGAWAVRLIRFERTGHELSEFAFYFDVFNRKAGDHQVIKLANAPHEFAGAVAESRPIQASLRSMISVSEPSCVWLGASGEQLLERRVAALSVTDARVEVAVTTLSDKANLPMSFIQTDPDEAVSLDLHETTVRQALDAIVARAPLYRYAIVSNRLVLYPRDPKWEMQLNDVHLGPGPRIRITRELARELSRRLPAFADLSGGWTGFAGSGKAYTYEDSVSVTGPGSVLELLVQLLGHRPSTYFFVVKQEGFLGPGLSVSSRDQLQSLKLTAVDTTLRHRDQQIQLKLTGTLRRASVAMDLTSGACGAVYKVSDEKVLSVSQDGLVTAKGNGTAQVTAELERSVAEVTIKVDLPIESGSLP